MERVTVSELARRAGTSADTIRYYERIRLLPQAQRSAAGYRMYGPADVERLNFIKGAQRFGLQLDEIRELMDIRERGLCPCGHARRLLTDKLAEIDSQLDSLTELKRDVETLIEGGVSDDAREWWPCAKPVVQLESRPRRRTS